MFKKIKSFFSKKPVGIDVGTKEFISVHEPGLRNPSTIERQEINLVLNHGGIGDFIYWIVAIEWVFKEHPHLFGSVLAPRFFHELACHWLSGLKDRVVVRSFDKLDEDDFFLRRDKYFLCPNGAQLVNSCGAHLLDIGFRYYANLDEIPDGYRRMPKIVGDEVSLAKFYLPKKYVVVTSEATSPIRRLKADTINGIVDWVRDHDLVPIFLGKSRLAHDYKTHPDEGVKLERVIDLRERTTLLEAACILAHAQAVVGLDNGLLHLAACSRVPVIMGFNTVDPRHRAPIRDSGLKTIAVMPNESLECRFCQSRVRYVMGHNFHFCLYKDNRCLDMLTAKTFIDALEKVLV